MTHTQDPREIGTISRSKLFLTLPLLLAFAGTSTPSTQHELKTGGMTGVVMEGTAKIDGKAVKTGAAILVTPKKKGVFLLAFVDASKEKQYEHELDAIAQSLKLAN